jgi:hypothetical protein
MSSRLNLGGGSSGENNKSSRPRKAGRQGKGGTGNDAGGKGKCHYCKKKGHWEKDCWKKKRDMAQAEAHVAHDDDQTLLLLQHAVPAPTPTALSTTSSATTSPTAIVNLVEKKVFADIDDTDKDPRRWILDTGATNHMTGSRAVFSDIDTGTTGTVRFGDGSVIKIEGCGTILYECKNGEHRTLDNVYFIPSLAASIISVGQLDERGYQVLVEDGVMRIRDENRRLLAKICRSPSRLYTLDINIARPVCLSAHANEDAWLWHSRFGHVNFTALRKMGRDQLVHGLPLLD